MRRFSDIRLLAAAMLWLASAGSAFAAADVAPELEDADVAIAEGGPTGEHAGRDYNKPPLAFEPALAIWSLVTFLVFVFVARRFAWQPLIAGLDAREARINRALADAEFARQRAEQLLHEYQQRLATTDEQVRGIVAAARREAEQSKNQIIAEAEAEAEQIRMRAIADIESAREQALGELSGTIDRYAESTTARLLGRR
ncbi:MAG: F0F1 ATP synthase subunit B [Planctomycetes bacterium]|nr:F0F1 ATP synthase subunit B [Planctomycetota bacterium]